MQEPEFLDDYSTGSRKIIQVQKDNWEWAQKRLVVITAFIGLITVLASWGIVGVPWVSRKEAREINERIDTLSDQSVEIMKTLKLLREDVNRTSKKRRRR